MPEFDGRIITVPFSFKETDPPTTGLPRYVADPERCARVADIAVSARPAAAHPARPSAGRARPLGLPDQALPDRQRGRPGHAGLGDPAAAGDAGRRLRPRRVAGLGTLEPVEGEEPDTTAGNALIHALIAAGGQDEEWLTAEQLSGQSGAHPGRPVPGLVRRPSRPS